MKKLLVILTFILFSTPALAEWTRLGESDDEGGYIIYADLTSMQKAGGRVRMWVLFDYNTEQKASGTIFLSKKMRRNYNCKEAGIRTLAFSLYSWNMEKGDLLRSYNQPRGWERIQPGSAKEIEWKEACGEANDP